MKLYYKKAACSLTIRIILNELNQPFDALEVDTQAKTYEGNQDFREINPKGSVPVLQLDNGAILTENAAILQYLADNFDENRVLPALKTLDRYQVLAWLNFVATELHKGFAPLFNPKVPEALKTEIFKAALKLKFAYVDQNLKNNQFLHPTGFTLPDAYLYVVTRWAVGQHIDLKDLIHLTDYVKRLETRDSIKKSLEQEKLVPLYK